MNTKTILASAYLGSILAAAYAITHVGTQYAPGAPHVLPVWPGIEAPSGVYVVGVTLVLRDLLQRAIRSDLTREVRGRGIMAGVVAVREPHERAVALRVLALIFVGAALSALISPAVAIASGVAFAVSESVDFGVFTLTESRLGLYGAIVASNAVSIVVDSLIFLALAFGSLAFIEGQTIGKALATLAAVVVLWLVRGRQVVAA